MLLIPKIQRPNGNGKPCEVPGQMPSRLQRLYEARKMLVCIVTGNEQALREPQRRLEVVGGLGAE